VIVVPEQGDGRTIRFPWISWPPTTGDDCESFAAGPVRNTGLSSAFAHTSLATWNFTVGGPDAPAARWTWDEFQALPHETITTDIHCVTKWSKLDTVWEGVPLDALLAEAATRGVRSAPYVLAISDGGYTTNLPLADLSGGKAWVAVKYNGAPLAPEHGGPSRLLVPHLYFWKSAKWLRELRFMEHDRSGFWESLGYHNYGDPWREQRYSGD
jgi:DMSO/TMAO reductase YedYZ molybdopterin-dependent catalytic subunit